MSRKSVLLLFLAVVCVVAASQAPELEAEDVLPGIRRELRAEAIKEPESLPGTDIDDEDDDDKTKHKPIAQVLEEALKEEFKKEEELHTEVGKQFNETVQREEGKQETVVIISQKKTEEEEEDEDYDQVVTPGNTNKPNDVNNKNSNNNNNKPGDTTKTTTGDGVEKPPEKPKIELPVETEVDRIIDSHDNVYVLSKPNEESSMEINLDPQLIRDLSVLIATSAAAGAIMETLGQPSINGYFLAGSIVGPGGLKLIKEIVQVQSLSQLGVQLLLFSLGLEFSLGRLRAVRNVAIFGGLIQIAAMSAVSGLAASAIGVSGYQGAFVGALISMSSTSIVVKCLMSSRTSHMQHAQITIGTLVLQDCVVGLLFAFMPVLAKAGSRKNFQLTDLLWVSSTVFGKLVLVVVLAAILARTLVPAVARVLQRYSSEAFQMAMLAFCLCTAMVTARLGISAELGAFLAGAMITSPEYSETVLHHIEPLLHFFMALFISSTGLVMSPTFLIHHLPVLASGVLVIICMKSILIALVVLGFGYPSETAMAVGINLAQIGEFSFVLFSLAASNKLIGSQVYLLLMGVTALSLLATPFLLQLSIRLLSKVAKNVEGVDLELASLMGNAKSRKDNVITPPTTGISPQSSIGVGKSSLHTVQHRRVTHERDNSNGAVERQSSLQEPRV